VDGESCLWKKAENVGEICDGLHVGSANLLIYEEIRAIDRAMSED